MENLLLIGGVILLVIVALGVIISRIYHTVPPNQVMVLYGRGKQRFITSGGVIVIPILQRYARLDVTIMTIKTIKDEVYTTNGVPIQLDWVAQVQIDTEESALATAAKAFLGKSREEVRGVIEETLSANFRAIVGQMTVETIHRDRDDFVRRVQDLASDDVAAMGVRVISMGIEEITDNQGYLEAMAAPQIAAVKRDAKIAEAEAERAARIKSAQATREAEQAELNAQREILAEREALQLREVEVQRRIDIERANADQEIQQKRALAVEQQQEAEVLVPARAERQSIEIRAEAERRRIEIEAEAERNKTTITADAQAQATRQRAMAESEAIERKGQADAIAWEAKKRAEAEGQKAEADAVRAQLLAEAEGQKAKLLAEAQGRRELAAASAAENAINLRQFIVEEVTKADVAKAEAIAQALAGLGNNVRMVQIGNSGGGNGASNSSFLNMLMDIPEVAEVFRSKVEALSGEDFKSTVDRVMTLFNGLQTVDFGTSDSSSSHSAAATDSAVVVPADADAPTIILPPNDEVTDPVTPDSAE